MEQIICLSGWGQSHDSIELSLDEKIKSLYKIKSIDYLKHSSFESFINDLSDVKNPVAVIGWSLGGQLAIRLCELKILNPAILFLIAPPFQLVKDNRIQAGMSVKIYQDFHQNLVKAPSATLKKFAILSIMNDKNRNEIIANISTDDSKENHLIYWLEELKRFSCFNVDFSKMPRSKFFIGNGDMIVHPSQVEYFKERIANCEINYFSNCGHAPHLNDPKRFNEIIHKELTSLKL